MVFHYIYSKITPTEFIEAYSQGKRHRIVAFSYNPKNTLLRENPLESNGTYPQVKLLRIAAFGPIELHGNLCQLSQPFFAYFGT